MGGVRLVFTHASGQRSTLILAYLLKATEAVLAVAPLLLLYVVMSGLLEDRASGLDDLVFWTAAIAALYGLRIVLGYVSGRLATSAGLASIRNLRHAIVAKVESLPLGELHGPSYGQLNALVAQDVLLLELLPVQVFPAVITFLVVPVTLCLVLAWVDPRMTLILLLLLPLAGYFFHLARSRTLGLNRKRSEAIGEVSFRLLEFVRGIKVFRMFGMGENQRDELGRALEAFREANLQLVYKLVPPLLLQAGLLELGPVLLLGFGLYFFAEGSLGIAALVLFVMAGFRFSELLRQLTSSLEIYEGARAAVERVEALMSRAPLPEPSKPAEPGPSEIVFDRVAFRRGGVEILGDVSFKAEAGSFVAIVGESGAGKSSLLRLIARYWDVDEGRILLGGVDLRDLGSKALHARIGIATQEVMVFRDSLYDNIALADRSAGSDAVRRAAEICRCDEIGPLEAGEEGRGVNFDGNDLSGGERQRIALARAVLKPAPLLLLDEVTAALDAETERQVLKRLRAEVFPGRSVFMVAHRLSTVVGADRILLLDKGRIVEDGTHDQLLARGGQYAALWQEA